MDNLTHSLVGLVAAKAGLERLSPGATALCLVAANAPDADIVTAIWGRWFYLYHHRGITHSILGAVSLAIILPALFYGAERLIQRVRKKRPRFKFTGLLVASIVAGATHPLMDWTNNYGVRPFLPWSRQWYYGDFIFIIDPYMWLVLGGAAFLVTADRWWKALLWALPALGITAALLFNLRRGGDFGLPLTTRAVWVMGILVFIAAHYVRLAERRGKEVALAALATVVIYWGALSGIHARAEREAQSLAASYARSRGETVGRVAAMPTLANPLVWRCVAETDRSTFLFYRDISRETDFPNVNALYEKPVGEAAAVVGHASKDYRAQVFLDFARFPITRTRGDCLTEMLVQFADLRYTEPGGGGQSSFKLDVTTACPPEGFETESK